MAQVPYNPVADVQPDARPPDNDYQRIEATPASFGGLIAQGGEKAGQGALDLSKFWGNVQAQDAGNKAEKEGAAYAEYVKSLQGQDRLNEESQSAQKLEAIRQKWKDQVGSPDAQLRFETQTTPYFNRFLLGGQINPAFNEARRTVAATVNNDSFLGANNMAATAGSSGSSDPNSDNYWWKNVEVARAKAFMSQKSQAQQEGVWDKPDVQQTVSQKANATIATAIETRATTNPDDAWLKVQDPQIKTMLGSSYDKVYATVRENLAKSYISRADQMLASGDPKGAQAFVEANADKYGATLGATMLRMKESVQKADAQTGASQALSAASGGWQPPAARNNDIKIIDGTPYHLNGTPYTQQEIDASTKAPTQTPVDTYKRYATQQGGPVTPERVSQAIYGQESGGGANTRTSITGAQGGMQVEPATFAQYARPGENIANRQDNINVGNRIVADYMQRYGGDPARVAVAYFSGPGNVAPPGSPTPWITDRHDPTGKYVSSYVSDIMGRLGRPGVSGGVRAPPVGHDVTGPSVEPLSSTGETAPPTQPIENAAFTPNAPTAPMPPVPADPVTAAYETHAAALDYTDRRQDIDTKQKEDIKQELDHRLSFAIAEAGMQAQAIKARQEDAQNDVLGTQRRGDVRGAFDKLKSYVDTGVLKERDYDTLSTVLAERSGRPNPLSVGPKYDDILHRMLLPDGDPNRIGSKMDILRAEEDGDLTWKGADDLMHKLDAVHKDLDQYGYAKNNDAMMSYMKRHLVRENAYPGDKSIDQKGQDRFESVAVPLYNAQYDQWQRARQEGKGPESFPLWDQKNLNALLETVYPRREREADLIGAGGGLTPEAPGTPAPAPPQGVNPDAWNSYMGRLPTIGGQPIPHAVWGQVLDTLRSDPTPEVFAAFNRRFGSAKFDAAEVVRDLVSAQGPSGAQPTPAAPALAPATLPEDWRLQEMGVPPKPVVNREEDLRRKQEEVARMNWAMTNYRQIRARPSMPVPNWRERAMGEE